MVSFRFVLENKSEKKKFSWRKEKKEREEKRDFVERGREGGKGKRGFCGKREGRNGMERKGDYLFFWGGDVRGGGEWGEKGGFFEWMDE